ncbi:MAG: AsmA family protein [Proteobacteria bacterium]|nr:AsmA family protein [Pseudomonadota bacterium]
MKLFKKRFSKEPKEPAVKKRRWFDFILYRRKPVSKRKRRLDFIFRAIVMFFGGLIVSVFVAFSQVNLETLRTDIVDVLQSATGMPVQITGKVSWKFSLRPRVTLSDVSIQNAPWAKNKNGVKIDTLTARLNLISLFSDRPAIQEMTLTNVSVFLERNAKGDWSIAPKASENAAAPDPDAIPYDFDFGMASVEVINPKITVITPNGKNVWALADAKVARTSTDAGVTYTGYIEKDKQTYSFVATLSKLDPARKVFPVRVEIDSAIAPVVINAALEQTSHIPIDFNMRGTIADLHAIGALANQDWPAVPKFDVNLSGGFGYGYNSVTINKSAIKMGNHDFTVSGTFDWGDRVPAVYAAVKSKNVNLPELFPDWFAPRLTKWVRPNRPLNLFKDIPLHPEMMRAFNANVDIDIGNLASYGTLKLTDVGLHLDMQDGNLAMNVSTRVASGKLDVAVHASDDNGTLVARLAGRGSGIVMGDVLKSQGVTTFIDGLPTDFMFYFESWGRDLSEFMANLDGPMTLTSNGRGYALADLATYFYGRDFLTSLQKNVKGFLMNKPAGDTMRIKCLAANFKVRSGRVETERGIALETSEVNIRATGFADFGKEKMQASFVTTPVHGLKISFSGNVANSIEFTGSLAEPSLKMNANPLIGKAIATGLGILLAPFTGGLSVVAGAGLGFLTGDLLANWLADDTPCKTALTSGAPAKPGDPEFMNRPLSDLVGEMVD